MTWQFVEAWFALVAIPLVISLFVGAGDRVRLDVGRLLDRSGSAHNNDEEDG